MTGRARIFHNGKWWRDLPAPRLTLTKLPSERRSKRKRRPAAVPPEAQAAVQRLTAWQRHQWARDGYRAERIARFAAMRHL